MSLSVFDLMKVGIGPSSSHTVGPMRAAVTFIKQLQDQGLVSQVVRIETELYGSLGATGKGHDSDIAVVLGLLGESPETVEPRAVKPLLDKVAKNGQLPLGGTDHIIAFQQASDVILNMDESLPYHPNGMTLRAFTADQKLLLALTYYSIGGGFVVDEAAAMADTLPVHDDMPLVPYPFSSGMELLAHCDATGMSISQIIMENEKTWRTEDEIRTGLLHMWQVMQDCVNNGCHAEGVLPGGLNVKRRAAELYGRLNSLGSIKVITPQLSAMDWVNLYAMAVNEENAAGGRIVTAPTNGAAGVMPAVMHYYANFYPGANDEGIIKFMLAAAAVGILCKLNASISGAEVGCQGEVGSACAMAAAGLAEVIGGTPMQVENAAEIGMEHNLGLTCDPIAGLVQVPCIERNAMAAIKAINAAHMALRGDGEHLVSLDDVIKTMRDTGADMQEKYKETSRGGLAVNVINC
jgi:L-serine dehydratase